MSKISNYFRRETPDACLPAVTKPRQTLGTIQSAADRGLTRPEERLSKGKKIIPPATILKVYEDPKLQADQEAQTDISGAACPQCVQHSTPLKEKSAEDEAYELLIQDEPPLGYWKALAEERRAALDDSLAENEQLYTEVKQLQDENERLTDLAKDAEYFAELLQTATGTEDAENQEEAISASAESSASQ